MKQLILGLGVIALLAQACSSTKQLPYDPLQVYPVRVDSVYGFINRSGDMIVKPQFDSLAWYNAYPIGVRKDGLWGYIGKHGDTLFEPQWQQVSRFVNGRAWFQFSVAHGLITEDGRKLLDAFYHFPADFHQGLCLNVQGAAGECVIMDRHGNVRNSDFCFHDHNDGIGLYQARGRFGYATLDDRIIIESKYARADIFSEGVAPAALDSTLYGYIDTSENWVIPPRFKIATPFRDSMARVLSLTGEWGLIDHTGKFLTPPRYTKMDEFRDGLAKVSMILQGREMWGLIDTAGRVVVEPQYIHIGAFSEGLAPFSHLAKQGFLNTSGEVVIEPRFQGASNFSEGLAVVSSGRKKGYIGMTGKVVIPIELDDAGTFFNGLAMVTEGGTIHEYFSRKPGVKLKYIDRKEKVIWESK